MVPFIGDCRFDARQKLDFPIAIAINVSSYDSP